MNLNDYIATSIFNYPTLYCKSTYQESRIAVLNQLFLVIGNGVDFKPRRNGKGFFSEWESAKSKRKKLNKADIQRIINGEKLALVYSNIDERLASFGILFGDTRKKVVFYEDLRNSDEKYLLFDSQTVRKPTEMIDVRGYKKFVEIYPQDDKEYKWHPYPFSLEHSSLFDDKTRELIKSNRIADDWKQGIVEIFKITKAWFEDDKSFMADKYFNWIERLDNPNESHFLKNWNKATDKLKFCDEYEIPRKQYTDPKEMGKDIIIHRREKSVKDCEKVIKLYMSKKKYVRLDSISVDILSWKKIDDFIEIINEKKAYFFEKGYKNLVIEFEDEWDYDNHQTNLIIYGIKKKSK